MIRAAVVYLVMCLAVAPTYAKESPTLEAARALAPTGQLRAAINFGNPVLAQKDTVTGQPKGVSVELARELARRLDVPITFVTYDSAGQVFDAVKTGGWDIAFLAIDPVRANEIDFSPPYVIIEGTYLVPVDSPLHIIGDLQRPGLRIAVGRGSAYDLFLTRNLTSVQLVRAPTSADAITLFQEEKLDAAAGVKQPLAEAAKNNPSWRVIPGRFMTIEQAMGTPKGHDAAYLRLFIEEMKASGFVARALAASGQTEAEVAPPAAP